MLYKYYNQGIIVSDIVWKNGLDFVKPGKISVVSRLVIWVT